MKQAKLTRAKPGDIAIYLFFILLAFITIYPFYYVVIMSLANAVATSTHVPYILPYVFDFTGYITVFQDAAFFQALGVSLFVTIVGVTINMTLSIMGAYALSKKTLIGRKVFLYLILFTMLFSGGLVPSYLNIKNLGMVNSIWSMIIPTALSTYYMIIMKNYFLSLPPSLEEAARIDGAIRSSSWCGSLSRFPCRLWPPLPSSISAPTLTTRSLPASSPCTTISAPRKERSCPTRALREIPMRRTPTARSPI